jgi:hypothetical protein
MTIGQENKNGGKEMREKGGNRMNVKHYFSSAASTVGSLAWPLFN